MAQQYKSFKRGYVRHLQLAHWIMATEAWTTMPPGPRALYFELKRRYNGFNNGEIFLSHRDAAIALNIHQQHSRPLVQRARAARFHPHDPRTSPWTLWRWSLLYLGLN